MAYLQAHLKFLKVPVFNNIKIITSHKPSKLSKSAFTPTPV